MQKLEELEKIEETLKQRSKLVPKMTATEKNVYFEQQRTFQMRKAAAQIYEEELE